MTNYVPDHGDVVWIDLNPQKGREQAKRRPFLTLSPRAYNAKVGLFIGCPITSQIKGYPFEVSITLPKKMENAVLADQVKSLDWKERNAAFITTVNKNTVSQVVSFIKLLMEG